MLDLEWDEDNSKKPMIRKSIDKDKSRDSLPIQGDVITISNIASTELLKGLGYTHNDSFWTVSIDIGSKMSEERFWKVVNEARRILLEKRAAPGSGYTEIVILRINDISNKDTIGVFRIVLDVELRRWNEVVS